MLKELKRDTMGRHPLIQWENLILLRCQYYPQQSTDLIHLLSKPQQYFLRMGKLILIHICEVPDSQKNLEKGLPI